MSIWDYEQEVPADFIEAARLFTTSMEGYYVASQRLPDRCPGQTAQSAIAHARPKLRFHPRLTTIHTIAPAGNNQPCEAPTEIEVELQLAQL
jgi:hypothetical protein